MRTAGVGDMVLGLADVLWRQRDRLRMQSHAGVATIDKWMVWAAMTSSATCKCGSQILVRAAATGAQACHINQSRHSSDALPIVFDLGVNAKTTMMVRQRHTYPPKSSRTPKLPLRNR